MENAITLSKFTPPTAKLSREAIIVKSKAIEALQGYKDITNDKQAYDASISMKAAKSLCKDVEATRKAIIEPLLTAQRDAMAKKNEFVQDIEVETKRLSGLLGVYEKAKRVEADRIKREEQEKLRLENERIRKEAAERQRKEKEESDLKIAEAKEANDKVAENQARLDKHDQKTRIDAETKELEKQAKQKMTEQIIQSKPAVKIKMRDTWKFEVEDINKLQLIHPELVTVSPNNVAIRAAIKDCKHIAGLRIYNEPTAI